MSPLPDSTQRRIDKLVDRGMYHNEAQYHHQVRFMQRWLDMTQMALRDEGADEHFIECVLNRLVYGVPDPNDAHERIDMREYTRELMEKMPLNQRNIRDLLDGSLVRPARPGPTGDH